ncbi:MAG: hypothetical protein AB3N16_01555 [Flavobacteriaceae bacterium]
MDKRKFTKTLLTTISSVALMDALFAYNAIGHKVKPILDHWAIRLYEYCSDVRTEVIPILQWQQKMEELYRQVPLDDILRFIDFDHLIKGFDYPDLGVETKPVRFPKLDGLPQDTIFVKKIFGMKKDRAIIPHGHSNMASSHIILKGEMHLRHYEKLQQEPQSLIITPTIDRFAKVGESSTISDEKDNVHWFIAHTETAFTFDVILLDLNNREYDIHNLDIYEKEDLGNGSMRVPILDVSTALKKYGKHHHS